MVGLGLGYADLCRIKPDIILTSITPFGQTGPYARYQATDLTVVSMGGMARLYGDPDRPPVRISEPQAFSLGGLHGALGSVVAHYHRMRTGKGQHVDVSCQQAVVRALMIASEYWDILKINYTRQGSCSVSARPEPLGPISSRRMYPCKDGYVYALIAGGAQMGFIASSTALVKIANQDGFAFELADYDWTQLNVSRISQAELDRIQDILADFFLVKTKAELFEAAIEHGILLIPVNDVTEVMESPQLASRNFFVDVEHPELNRCITYPGFPVKAAGFEYRPRRRPPLIGEHTREIARETMPTEKPVPILHSEIAENADSPFAGQVFEGLKVADFSWVGAGPQVGRELAEHGATVIRVESHRRPDTLRLAAPFKDGIPGIDRSAFGMAYNTNKLGMSLDLSLPKGREIARRLVAWADLVADSMTPGSLKKFGLDYESCKKIKPDVIYYSTCQMGQEGPLSTFGGYGAFGVAYGGYSHLTGWPDRPPTPLFNNYSDFIAPWYLATVVVLALDYRHRTGRGLYLDQAQVEAGVTCLAPAVLDYTVNGRAAVRRGNRDPYMCPHGIFPCRGEDEWVAIAVRSEAEWKTFCSVVEKPEWVTDPRFAALSERKQNEDALERLIGDWTQKYSPIEVMEMMQAAVIPAGIAATAENLFDDPQLSHRQHYRFLDHGVIGKAAHNAPAYILSKTPCRIHKAGPCLGEDNEVVYKEILGCSDDEFAELMVEGVITTEYDVPDALKSK
jgi:crotonobetainyl-CoA:carnitine CoA-transferase CaiB-like acyl-CoA transferase